MIDIGEDLVGAYLRMVVECQIVQFNVRTGIGQGEIDVIGLRVDENRIVEAWFCEVSTHTGGLGGYQGDAVGKMTKKLKSVRAYAKSTYPRVTSHIQVWAPKVTPGMQSKLQPALRGKPDAELVCETGYTERIQALARKARTEKAYNDSSSFRLLQVLTRLPFNPLDLSLRR
jgi:Holliday junction resolvase-like predicted endonuclease